MANKIPTTAFGRLVRKLKNTPMTRKQITTFLLKETGNPRGYNFVTFDYYNSALYGTRARRGILEQYGVKTKDGRWTVPASTPESGPFTQYRG